MKPKLTEITATKRWCLRLRYDDGCTGEVDLADLSDRGVFKAWNAPGAFEAVHIGDGSEAVWDCGIDLCGDMLYLKLTGKLPEWNQAQNMQPLHRIDPLL